MLPVVNFAAVCSPHDADRQFRVEHVINHSVVTYADAPGRAGRGSFFTCLAAAAVNSTL